MNQTLTSRRRSSKAADRIRFRRHRTLGFEGLERRELLAGSPAFPDNGTAPPQADTPIIDFFALPAVTETNIPTFLVAASTNPGNLVLVNGSRIADRQVREGVFSVPVPLSPGANSVSLRIETPDGQPVVSRTQTVLLNENLSTANRRLVYVDVMPAPYDLNARGTVVIDPDRHELLGLLAERHVCGISPDGKEIYADDRTVLSTATHRPLRQLPFSSYIPLSGFVVSPTGDRLYAGREIVDVATNTLLDALLPVSLDTYWSWYGAAVPGGPAISSDGKRIFANNYVIDTSVLTATPTGVSGYYLGDIELSPDERWLLVSEYSYAAGRVEIYDTQTWQLSATIALSDFAGEIRFVGSMAIAGSAGNAAWGSGKVVLIDMASQTEADQVQISLGDNLATSATEAFVSAGETGSGRLGVDVYAVQGDELELQETYFLGVNSFTPSTGRPTQDEIRRIVYKPRPPGLWRNPVNPLDVDGAGDVTALDVLLVINHLNAHAGDASLPAATASLPPYFDVNGDDACTAQDVLTIINFLNKAQVAAGEGESDSVGSEPSKPLPGPCQDLPLEVRQRRSRARVWDPDWLACDPAAAAWLVDSLMTPAS